MVIFQFGKEWIIKVARKFGYFVEPQTICEDTKIPAKKMLKAVTKGSRVGVRRKPAKPVKKQRKKK